MAENNNLSEKPPTWSAEETSQNTLHVDPGMEKYRETGKDLGRQVISQADADAVAAFFRNVIANLQRLIVGNDLMIRHVIIALLSGGHILIEGPPGTAKTLTTKAIAHMTSLEFSRVQAAVDLQPADIIGIRVFDIATKQFEFKKGPLFTNILMIDEINRLSPKTQGAFIEAMSERQVTVDGTTMPLASPFFVIATQNPYEFEGTFPLIEVQRDRFMFYHRSGFMDAENELLIIRGADEGALDWNAFQKRESPFLSLRDIERYRSLVKDVYMSEEIKCYIRDIVVATRGHGDIHLGVSSRGSIALVSGSKSLAAIHGRTFVIPDDVKDLAMICLPHRIVLTKEAVISNIHPAQVIQEILDSTGVP